MAACYTNVSISEMRNLLKSEKGWREESNPVSRETIFQYVLPKHPNILIKVYSGIKLDSGVSRKCGADSIKVCAIDSTISKGWIKSKRVHRTQNWRETLKGRVCQVIRDANGRFTNV